MKVDGFPQLRFSWTEVPRVGHCWFQQLLHDITLLPTSLKFSSASHQKFSPKVFSRASQTFSAEAFLRTDGPFQIISSFYIRQVLVCQGLDLPMPISRILVFTAPVEYSPACAAVSKMEGNLKFNFVKSLSFGHRENRKQYFIRFYLQHWSFSFSRHTTQQRRSLFYWRRIG